MEDKYVFLDRDGVINEDGGKWTEHGYISRWEDFKFLPGVLKALKELTAAGYKIVVISNQQGVAKGYYTEEELNGITKKMIKAIETEGGHIADVYYCMHLEKERCSCRKPKGGLFEIAKKKLDINKFDDNFFVGDTERDMQAGKDIGLRTILVLSGKSLKEDAEGWEYKPDYICEDLKEAVKVIINSR
ncbi:MAG: D-glycero-beta-D-manno-heptose 1,7-bisphosphate 7-phosphatase [Candidatus Omnitrophota bacterium]